MLLPLSAACQADSGIHGKYKITKGMCLRAEAGWNRSWFASLGASYIYSNVNAHLPVSAVVYAAAEIDRAGYRSRNTFYAYKAGFEFSGGLRCMGFELRNNTDLAGNNQLVFTPKIGLSAFGYINLYYGYNLFDRAFNPFGISHNQFSLSLNLSRKFFKKSVVPQP